MAEYGRQKESCLNSLPPRPLRRRREIHPANGRASASEMPYRRTNTAAGSSLRNSISTTSRRSVVPNFDFFPRTSSFCCRNPILPRRSLTLDLSQQPQVIQDQQKHPTDISCHNFHFQKITRTALPHNISCETRSTFPPNKCGHQDNQYKPNCPR
jgi:hypothetical protein